VLGRQHQTQITVIDPVAGSGARHLNKHINYAVSPAPPGVQGNSLALPRGVVVSGDGSQIYGCRRVRQGGGPADQRGRERLVPPSVSDHIVISGGGPSGLALDEGAQPALRAHPLRQWHLGGRSATRTETRHYRLPNPEPPEVVNGRVFLHDANRTSSNGEAACGSCQWMGIWTRWPGTWVIRSTRVLNNPLAFTLGPVDQPQTSTRISTR
jgi:hypothetical protein